MQRDLSNEVVVHREKNGVQYLQFRRLLEYEEQLAHCFSTRIGDEHNNFNLDYNRDNSSEFSIENHKKICEIIDVDYRNMVFSNQVHEDVIRKVGMTNRGEGLFKPVYKPGCDGLMVDLPNVGLITIYADCVPILFYDPSKNIAAISHAGWRGTVKKIAAKTVRSMQEAFGCCLQDVIACIGPSIGSCCFEVDETVALHFKDAFTFWPDIIETLPTGKSKINLWEANKLQLLEAGLSKENIEVSRLCTVCNSEVFYSFRADKGKTGRMAAIMQIK